MIILTLRCGLYISTLLWAMSQSWLSGQDIKVYLTATNGHKFVYTIVNNSDYEIGGLCLGESDSPHKNPAGQLLLRDVIKIIGPIGWYKCACNDTEQDDCYMDFARDKGNPILPHSIGRGFTIFTKTPTHIMQTLNYRVSYTSTKVNDVIEIRGKIQKCNNPESLLLDPKTH